MWLNTLMVASASLWKNFLPITSTEVVTSALAEVEWVESGIHEPSPRKSPEWNCASLISAP